MQYFLSADGEWIECSHAAPAAVLPFSVPLLLVLGLLR